MCVPSALDCWSFCRASFPPSHLPVTPLGQSVGTELWTQACGFPQWKNPQLRSWEHHLPSGQRGNTSLGSGLHLRHLNLVIFQPKSFCESTILLPVWLLPALLGHSHWRMELPTVAAKTSKLQSEKKHQDNPGTALAEQWGYGSSQPGQAAPAGLGVAKMMMRIESRTV